MAKKTQYDQERDQHLSVLHDKMVLHVWKSSCGNGADGCWDWVKMEVKAKARFVDVVRMNSLPNNGSPNYDIDVVEVKSFRVEAAGDVIRQLKGIDTLALWQYLTASIRHLCDIPYSPKKVTHTVVAPDFSATAEEQLRACGIRTERLVLSEVE